LRALRVAISSSRHSSFLAIVCDAANKCVITTPLDIGIYRAKLISDAVASE